MMAVCSIVLAAALLTPETSKHFEKFTDPYSGAVSYILKTRLGNNQQSFYFTNPSMTEDGRFLLFSVSDSHKPQARKLGMVDFRKDTCTLLNTTGWMPFIAMENDILYSVNGRGFFKRNLAKDPMEEELICEIPEPLKREGERIFRYCTHLHLTRDRKGAFLDLRIDDRFLQGMVNLEKGTWEKWGETDFHINHGQLNPQRDDLALCAYECVPWTDTKGVEHKGLVLENGIYPRLQLIAKGRRKMIPAKVFNSASHEKWSADGRGFYWCGGGVWYHDLFTKEQTCLCPMSAAHATCSADLKLVTYDSGVGVAYWRGQPWQVGFYNRETGRGLYIFSRRDAYCPQEDESGMHPDPHPQFCTHDRYIVCTVNHGDGRMDLAVTPVTPLIAVTTPKKDDPYADLVGMDSPYTVAARLCWWRATHGGARNATIWRAIDDFGRRFGDLNLVEQMKFRQTDHPKGDVPLPPRKETAAKIISMQHEDGLWGEEGREGLELSALLLYRLVQLQQTQKGREAEKSAEVVKKGWRAISAKFNPKGEFEAMSDEALAAIVRAGLEMNRP